MYLFLSEVIICLVFTILLYLTYAMKNTRLYVSILVIVVWFLTFLAAVIIPFDIYSSSQKDITPDDPTVARDLSIYRILYIVIYWTIYILSWIVIPIAQEYEAAGDFSPSERMKRAIIRNIVMYAIFIVIGVIFILYLIINKQLTGGHLIAFLVALANAWGIFLIIFLLGYGLIAVPKHVIKLADYETRIKNLEWNAGECEDNLLDRRNDLINDAYKIKSVRSILADGANPNKGFVEKIWIDLEPLNLQFTTSQDSTIEEELKQLTKKFTYEEVIDLNMKIKRNKYDIRRLNCEREEIFQEWLFLNNLLGKESGGENFEKNCWMKTKKFYYLKFRPVLILCLAFILIIFSLGTILSEITLFTNLPLSIFGLLIDISSNIVLINIFCLVPQIFLFLTSLYGFFSLKVSGFYAMYTNQNTDSISLLFLASFMCRIGIPLCLNFVQILKLTSVKMTVIEELMGITDFIPVLGKNFIIFYPTILIFLCLFNLFDIYGKFANMLGFYSFGFKNAYNDEKIEDGRDALIKMKIVREREKNDDNTTLSGRVYQNLNINNRNQI